MFGSSQFDRILFAALLAFAAITLLPAPALALQDEEEEEMIEEIDSPPPVQFDPPTAEFGFVKPKSLSKKDVKIWNKSDKPLTILAIQPGCKCTTLNDLAGTEIPVGGYVTLETQLKSQPSPGPKKTEVKILIEGYSRIASLSLNAEVAHGVRALPGTINAVSADNMKGRIFLESIDGQTFRVLALPKGVTGYVNFDPAKDEPASKYVLDFDLSQVPEAEIPRYLVMQTDHPDAPVLDVAVRHRAVLANLKFALRPTDMRANLGLLEAGKPHEFEVEFEAASAADPILTVRFSGRDADVRLIKSEQRTNDEGKPVTVATVALTPKPDASGILYGTTTFYTQGREQAIYTFGAVKPAAPSDATGSAAGR